MEFIYTGQATLANDDIEEFMATATDLMIKGIAHLAKDESLLESHVLHAVDKDTKFDAEYLSEDSMDANERFDNIKEPSLIDFEDDLRNNSTAVFEHCEIVDNPNSTNNYISTLPKNNHTEHTVITVQNRQTKMLECNQCDYSTNRRDVMKGHQSAKHDGIKYFCYVKMCARVY